MGVRTDCRPNRQDIVDDLPGQSHRPGRESTPHAGHQREFSVVQRLNLAVVLVLILLRSTGVSRRSSKRRRTTSASDQVRDCFR